MSLAWAGCASSGSSSSGGDGATGGATAPGGQGGGASGGGATGGNDQFPCGQDCTLIEHPDCYVGECNTETKLCAVKAAPVTTACDDGKFCTLGDHCQAGECVGGSESNTCGLEGDDCNSIACDEDTDTCVKVAASGNPMCTPTTPCMINGLCQNGICVSSDHEDCSWATPPDDCHIMSCNSQNGACEPIVGNNGGTCTDPSNKCLVGGTCSAGTCSGTTLNSCSQLTQGCQVGVCDTNTGACSTTAAADNTACSNLVGCTAGETCLNGVCQGGAAISTCGNSDQCCPSGCTESNDTLCGLTVLLMAEGVSDPNWDVYRAALRAAGVAPWAEIKLTSVSVFPSVAQLDQYNTVIWATESSMFSGGLTADVDAALNRLSNWLTAGTKRLFVTGLDFGYSLQYGSAAKTTFWGLLGLTWDGSYGGATTINGVASDPISADFLAPNGLLLSDGYGADYVSPTTGAATKAGLYDTGSGAGDAGLTHYAWSGGGNSYRAVWLGTNFHDKLSSPAQRAKLMVNIINYFK